MLTEEQNDSPTVGVLLEGMSSGLHLGAQLVAMVEGQMVANVMVGNARLAADWAGGVDVPMRGNTLMLWLSAGKPVTATGILKLVEEGRVRLEQEVADLIPEFGTHGKEAITVRHLLTHTAGIRGLDLAYPFASWEETLGNIYDMKVEREWTPGMKAGYHIHTTWYVLGEMIHRVTGERPDAWIRRNILEPAGMEDTWLAMSAERYQAYGERIGFLYDTTVQPPRPLANYDTELALSRPRPSASCRGPLWNLARFYEMLRRGGEIDGVRVLKEETVRAMTARQRVGMFDVTFRQTIDWGLGVILNSSHYGRGIPYQFGPHASRETFGHGGSQSSTGFCDPVNKLVVALLFNGCPGEPAHDRRLRATLKALYEELGMG